MMMRMIIIITVIIQHNPLLSVCIFCILVKVCVFIYMNLEKEYITDESLLDVFYAINT